MQHPSGVRSRAGFTLIELVTVLAVAAILASVAVPAFAELQRRARAASAYSDLTLSLAAARLLAVRLGEPASVCPSIDGRRCADSTDWSRGWIVYADPGRDDHPATPAAIRHRGEAVADTLALRSTRGRRHVRFQPTGWSSGSNLSVRLCSRTSGLLLGKVVVNNAGRAYTTRLEDTPTACPFPL